MTDLEKTLLEQLNELENGAHAMRARGAKLNLLPVFERIDEITRQLPKETDPALLHYLHRKSYEKARLWLEGRDPENQPGSCRH